MIIIGSSWQMIWFNSFVGGIKASNQSVFKWKKFQCENNNNIFDEKSKNLKIFISKSN